MILPTALKAGHGCEGRMKVQCQEGFWRLRSHEVPFIRKKGVFLSDFAPQSHMKTWASALKQIWKMGSCATVAQDWIKIERGGDLIDKRTNIYI